MPEVHKFCNIAVFKRWLYVLLKIPEKVCKTQTLPSQYVAISYNFVTNTWQSLQKQAETLIVQEFAVFKCLNSEKINEYFARPSNCLSAITTYTTF